MSVISISLRSAACGADLRGCDVFGLCAECHRPVSKTIRVEALDDATLAIREDVPCAGCGYNLRTLALEAKCPECARPVADSLATNELHLADVKWLRRVRSGVGMLLIAGVVLAGALMVSMQAGAGGSEYRMIIAIIAAVIVPCLCAVGIIRVASRGHMQGHNNRSDIVRAFAICFALLLALPFLPEVIRRLAWSSNLLPVSGLVSTLSLLIGFLGLLICTLIFLRRIALLGKQKWLVRLSSSLIGALLLAGALNAFSIAFWSYVTPVPGSTSPIAGWSVLATIAFPAASFLYLINFIIGIILLTGYWRMLSDAIVVAGRRAAT